MNFRLPTTLQVNGRDEPIRYEYTAILEAISAMSDPNYTDEENMQAALYIIYENFENFGRDDYAPAFKAATEFMNNGISEETKNNVRMVDFDQDFKMMIPAINKVAGKEIRTCDDIHWWTFLSWFMEIGESTYSTVLSIRSKKAKGKKMEKWEQEFYAANKQVVDIQRRMSDEEKAEQEAWERKMNALLDS